MLDHIELVDIFSDNSQLVDLYKSVSLGHRSPQQIATAFQNSRYTVFALKNGKLIGAGRAFGDETDCAVICDLAVHPEFQGSGIGERLLAALKEQVRHHLRIILYANPGKEGFYLRRGFAKMKTAMITSYLLPPETARETGFIE
jgi:N-acetylglutamate synthase-like GNAT family acetyltransferase